MCSYTSLFVALIHLKLLKCQSTSSTVDVAVGEGAVKPISGIMLVVSVVVGFWFFLLSFLNWEIYASVTSKGL